MNKSKRKMQKETLEWLDPQSGATYHAGVAFYDSKHAEYRLVLDAPRTIYNLRAYEASESGVKYQVYAPILKNGRFSHKVEVGLAYSNKNTNGDIYITIGRYGAMRLVLRRQVEAQALAA